MIPVYAPVVLDIDVTRNDIVYGRYVPHACPIAISINRKLKEGFYAIIDNGTLYIYRRNSKAKTLMLPERAIRFMKRFDNRIAKNTLAPIEFSLIVSQDTKRRFFL